MLERGLADKLGFKVGDAVHLGGQPFTVTGVALTTAQPFFPARVPGLVWLTRKDAERLAAESHRPGYLLDLKLTDPSTATATPAAGAFLDQSVRTNQASILEPWQLVQSADYKLIRLDRKVLLTGAWLLTLLAIASIAVLVGGRMAQQTRRVGLLKAVGATPSFVALVLLAENLLLGLIGAVVGLAAGQLVAPSLASPGQGLVSSPQSPHLTLGEAALVLALAAAVAAAATIAPAVRAARRSTIRALSDPAHPPRRRPWLIAISAAMPVPLLLGLRLVGRRAGRAVLTAASLTVAVAMVCAALTVQHDLQVTEKQTPPIGLFSSATGQEANHVLVLLSVLLVVLAAISATFTTWATVIDARRSTALARALGATPWQTSAGLTAAQLLPGLGAACAGIPAGLLIYQLAGGDLGEARPPLAWLLALIPATLIVLAVLAAIPARIGARQPVADALRAE